ncbi:uncharacterized protein LOC110343500 [Mesocricetus auratus]|uniref:Uncharacterized protein LOC110343500 n=1 Tax=Mesocricetus auratus TaxID=10036 RepID=A0ABM2WLV0_MESAU|nr:uncharacterized protein LOC110343500 [Mesocricetus auratus]
MTTVVLNPPAPGNRQVGGGGLRNKQDQGTRARWLAGATGGHPPQTRRARRQGTPRPRQTRDASCGAARLHSARLRAAPVTPRPLAAVQGEGERAFCSPTLTSAPRPALRDLPPAGSACPARPSPGGRLGRKAARVPPCARRGTGLDGRPRGSRPTLGGVGCRVRPPRTWPRPRRLPRLGLRSWLRTPGRELARGPERRRRLRPRSGITQWVSEEARGSAWLSRRSPVSLPLNCESAVINTTAEEAPLSFTISGNTDHGFWLQHTSQTSPWPLESAYATDVVMLSSGSTDHRHQPIPLLQLGP